MFQAVEMYNKGRTKYIQILLELVLVQWRGIFLKQTDTTAVSQNFCEENTLAEELESMLYIIIHFAAAKLAGWHKKTLFSQMCFSFLV